MSPDALPTLCNGRYRLDRLLGQGGMASVYEAWDTRLKVYRAIKILAPHLARRASVRARFESEAQTMARLHHPHIVTVHDVADDGDRVLMVMELLKGGCLQDRIEQRRGLPPVEAITFTDHLLRALAFAHANAVIHRDIKPRTSSSTRAETPR